MQRLEKIGGGTYGVVYSALSPGGHIRAVKRRITSKKITFCQGVRELHVNKELGIHPYIISLLAYCTGKPFGDGPWTPLSDSNKGGPNARDDTIHFIYPLAKCNLFQYAKQYPNYRFPVGEIRRFSAQLLLGLEYIHCLGFIHRDIKMENLLLQDEDGILNLKIGDFGMAKPVNPYCVQTPGTGTSWYRDPVICSQFKSYGVKSDIWSAGCVIYEMLTGEPVTGRTEDDIDKDLVQRIINNLPYKVDYHVIRYFDDCKMSGEISLPLTQPTMAQFLRLTPDRVREIEAAGGYNNFVTMLMSMLQFDPRQRMSARLLLEVPFLAGEKSMITAIRAAHPPIKKEGIPYTVILCVERKWMRNVALAMYDERLSLKSWYTHRTLFQSIMIFDRVLENGSSHARKDIIPSEYRGQMMTREKAQLYYLACIYVAIKYFATMHVPVSFSRIAPEKFRTDEKRKIVEHFESRLIEDILRCEIYRETVYDILVQKRRPVDTEVRSLLIFVLNGHHKGRTPKDAFAYWDKNKGHYIK